MNFIMTEKETPIKELVLRFKSLGVKKIELKVTLSALCNTLGIKPLELQSGLLSVIDPTKRWSFVKIQLYKDQAPKYSLIESHRSTKLKALYTRLKENEINENEFIELLESMIKEEFQKKEKRNTIEYSKFKSQIMSNLKSFIPNKQYYILFENVN